ncbi:MAG: Gfo/Idh/MocA family oxidoreductase [Treponema sp.]|jgi:predicted dehydrogenase|nr:Gfo/Idh/MocA family oxidoreductase [Treponema sp.]
MQFVVYKGALEHPYGDSFGIVTRSSLGKGIDAFGTLEGGVGYHKNHNKKRGKSCADFCGVPFEKNLDAVLARSDIDGVMVECATVKHREVILRAAAAKKHVFSDKTLALSSADCAEIKEALEKAGVKFVLSMEAKIAGPYRYAKKLVEEGVLGRVGSAYFRRDHGAALDRFLPDYWYDPAQTGGGVTLDLGCHGFYLLAQFCGKPVRVVNLMNGPYGTGSDENSTTIVEFENGALGTAHTSFVSWKMDNLLEIIGSEGMFVATGTKPENYRVLLQSKNLPGYEEPRPVPEEEYGPDDEFPIVKFARLLQSPETETDLYGIDKAIVLARLVECAYRSAKTGQAVMF